VLLDGPVHSGLVPRRPAYPLIRAASYGIHPFCITLDHDIHDDLPHRYGAARFIILDDVRELPLTVTDIYRRITT